MASWTNVLGFRVKINEGASARFTMFASVLTSVTGTLESVNLKHRLRGVFGYL